jgi:hypothetical protein
MQEGLGRRAAVKVCLQVGLAAALAIGCGNSPMERQVTPDGGGTTADANTGSNEDAGRGKPDGGRGRDAGGSDGGTPDAGIPDAGAVPDAAVPGCQGDAECDDDDDCNGVETCDVPSGECRRGTPLDCSDPFACTANSCVDGACVSIPDDEICADRLACNGDEQCTVANGCVDGEPIDCGVTNRCFRRGCSEAGGGTCTEEEITYAVSLAFVGGGETPFTLGCGDTSQPLTAVCGNQGMVYRCQMGPAGRLQVTVTTIDPNPRCMAGAGQAVLTGCSTFDPGEAPVGTCCFE